MGKEVDWPKVEKPDQNGAERRSLHAEMIIHQANCVINQEGLAAGLAKTLFDKYEYADIYAGKHAGREPGTTLISHPPPGWRGPIIAHVLGQRRIGTHCEKETEKQRRTWFGQALKHLFHQIKEGLDRRGQPNHTFAIAIPRYIGCGRAGGNWTHYEQYVNQFCDQCHKHIETKIKFVLLNLTTASDGKEAKDGGM